ncbi:T9SS type A sorting domain-containing protein [Carboxylicivirga caseinilyticus]|uniref:T9SS type A sorting domain-containing protein n=1 Tax=Carboxylicivirga caseinilyticus TaxID=3417572 RepID=UPI003D33BD37|nr:T9SS type A sorting domain-containing protein [Marinilabiliaceae bacterium A049]
MKLKSTFFNLFLLFLFLWTESSRAQTITNRALEATVSTSHVSPWETLGAVNDGVSSTSSTAKPAAGAYGNWNGESFYNTYNWVQYEWPTAINIESTSVFWWSDGGGISKPTDAYIEYWNGVNWIHAGQIGIDLNINNSLSMGVWANKIRITMKSNTSTGIIEWQVFASDEAPCAASEIIASVQVNDGEQVQLSNIIVTVGDDVTITAQVAEEAEIYWFGPDGFIASGVDNIYLGNVELNQSGAYEIVCINDCGGYSQSRVNLTVSSGNNGSAYNWPAYDPPIYYDFKDEYPELEMPTQDLDDCANVAGRQSSGWWTFVWGPNARDEITEAAITPMLDRFNQDFAYFRDVMGWPPDKRAKNGYRSAIYLFGSGLCTDNADNTALGGWMGSIDYQGQSWPMVLASYYPVYSFDPACTYGDREGQMGAMIHEGIHAVLADLPGAKNAAWFHEGGNTWLQQEMESQKSGDYLSMGFLNAGALIAPFMPIECYSGWLQDDSFGGPSAEGVNMFDGDQQICTWRNLLGGNQYGNLFPVIFSQIFGDHSVAWIWRYCENRVLEGIADTLGEYQTRRLIMEYRAKQAMLDIGPWSGACRNLLDANFGGSIQAEWQPSWLNPEVWYATPYAKTSDDGTGLLTPEYRTTPGWSGANQIPLIVNADKVTVDFRPIGNNMSCQLCYRATDGSVVYGEPVFGGECTLNIDKPAANDVVFAVICNTDFIYEGEQTRKSHFDYRLKLVDGIKERAHWNVRWYQWDETLSNITIPTSIEKNTKISQNLSVYPNPAISGDEVKITFSNEEGKDVYLNVYSLGGRLMVSTQTKSSELKLNSSTLEKGIYILSVSSDEVSDTYKLIIQ